jgi:hypothetical protein
MRLKAGFVACSAAAFVLPVGCSNGVTLTPATAVQHHTDAGDVALAEREGVRVAASAQAWPGSRRVAKKLTPMSVEISNQSERLLHGAFTDIRLIVGEKQLSAQAPDAIDIEPQATTVGKTGADVDSRSGVYEFDTPSPAKEELSHQLRALSLPEGPIPQGQSVQGFVYFGPLPSDVELATLRVLLRDAPGGQVHAALDLPFTRQR